MQITKERRGFAAMAQEKQREISSRGGKAAHEKGTAHKFDADEARRAGRLGGEAVSQDRAHMAIIGARGGQSRGHHALLTASASGSTATSAEVSKSDVTSQQLAEHGSTPMRNEGDVPLP
jgi:general stress protein YciG